MTTHLVNLLALAITLSLPAGSAPEISTLQSQTYAPVSQIKQVSTLEENKLDLAPFPYLPMGSKSNSYAPRNCTWGAASMKPDVPNNWGNAAQWADHARAEGHTVSATPIVGAVAQHGGGYGHVAVVVGVGVGQVLITEMNFDWHGGVRTDWQPVGRYVYIWI